MTTVEKSMGKLEGFVACKSLIVLFALLTCYCWQPEKSTLPGQSTASGGM